MVGCVRGSKVASDGEGICPLMFVSHVVVVVVVVVIVVVVIVVVVLFLWMW